MSKITEEEYFACTVEGCTNFVVNDEPYADFWDCSTHGSTMTRKVRQFENGKMIAEFHAQPHNKEKGQDDGTV